MLLSRRPGGAGVTLARMARGLHLASEERSTQVRQLALSNRVRDRIHSRFSHELIASVSPYLEYQQLAPSLGRIVREELPASIVDVLLEQVLTGSPDAVLLSNVPLSPHPGPTPDEDKQSPLKGFVEEYFQLALIHLRCGELYHERHEKHGEAFAQVLSMAGHEQSVTSRGSGVQLNHHVDLPYIDPPIDFLSLLSVRGDPRAATTLVSLANLLHGLPAWVIDGMQQAHFEIRPSASWQVPQPPLIAAMLELDPRRSGQAPFNVRFNTDLVNRIRPITEQGGRVIQYLQAHLAQGLPQDGVVLDRGDCLIFNNRRLLHGRSAYQRSTSWEERRWLIRAYERTDWRRLMWEYGKAQATAGAVRALSASESLSSAKG